jgi:Cu/Ag efflux pump CusA
VRGLVEQRTRRRQRVFDAQGNFVECLTPDHTVSVADEALCQCPLRRACRQLQIGPAGTTINIYSQIGVLVLIGIMAKNGILMVEFADQLRDQGKSVLEAAREASIVRLRPIAMTMISTVLAGLPLILSAGPGSESRAAIGWVIFGGLGLAAVVTLFLTPAVYVLIAGLAKPRAAAADDLAEQMRRVGT